MSAEREGRDAAARYRAQHHLGTQPLGDLVALIDLVEGIDVAVIRSPADDTHGITVVDPETSATMIVAVATPNPTRLRSTIAHELAHHLFGDSAPGGNASNDRPHEESRANAFARHLLLPLEALADVLGPPEPSRPITEGDVSALVQRFALSPQMVAIQLCQGRYISDEQKTNWLTLTAPRLATRYGWSNLYSVWKADSEAIRPPQRLLARAVEGYANGLVSIHTIARLENISAESAEAALTEAGIVPNAPVAVPVADTELPSHGSRDALDAFDAEFGDDG
jgi:Zn-dependent peptidase ImmA (M78 family)